MRIAPGKTRGSHALVSPPSRRAGVRPINFRDTASEDRRTAPEVPNRKRGEDENQLICKPKCSTWNISGTIPNRSVFHVEQFETIPKTRQSENGARQKNNQFSIKFLFKIAEVFHRTALFAHSPPAPRSPL